MISARHLKTVGQIPLDRFVTTYMRDYVPYSEHHLQKNRPRPRRDVRPAPFFTNPLPTGHDFWTTFYRTSNSVYGSSIYPQARTQDIEVAEETRPLVGVGERDQLHYVHGGEALEQQETESEPQRVPEVLYEEGVMELTSRVCPACYQDHVRSARREAGLQHLPHLPVFSSPPTIVTDAENLDNSTFLRDLTTYGPGNSTYLQPLPRQCSCSTLPVVPVQSTVNYREPRREPVLTEYQASYTAERARPNIQQNTFSYVHLPPHQICYNLL